MAGVLFVVCIPRENYEKIISNKRQSTEDEEFETQEKAFNNDVYHSSSSISLQTSSLDSHTCAINLISQDDELPCTSRKAQFQELNRFKKPKDLPGSMDSEIFAKNMEREARARENEEAVEKFFSVNTSGNTIRNKSMECVMRDIIDKMQIRNVSWQKVNNGNSYKISFSLEKGVRCDDTIHLLSEYGIGQKKGSSCVIIPCSVYKDKSHLKKSDSESDEMFKETSWNRHIGNVRARLNVEKLVHAVKSDATLSFDFIVLLIVASMVASFGLLENSTLILTASMLISPLMGPILASTFGTIIKDHKLQFWGLRNEIVGVLLCVVVGYFFGVTVCLMNYISGVEIRPTKEMLSRCTWHSVIVGIFIALPSGAAQSIALLRENFGSLVGVAISASLLPPAVNTGLLWSFSCVNLVFQEFELSGFRAISLEKLLHSENQAIELLILGSLSLFLTITNVICVYFMGYIFLCIKIEVAPLSTEEERQFWKHDVPIARDYNKTLNAEEGKKLKEQLDEFREAPTDNFNGVAAELLKQDLYQNTHTWSPLMQKFNSRKDHQRKTVMDFNDFCKSMTPKTPADSTHHSRSHNNSKHERIHFVKVSEPIATPSSSNSQHNQDSFSEPTIRRKTTFIAASSTSNDEDKMHRKFIVTPAKDDYIPID